MSYAGDADGSVVTTGVTTEQRGVLVLHASVAARNMSLAFTVDVPHVLDTQRNTFRRVTKHWKVNYPVVLRYDVITSTRPTTCA